MEAGITAPPTALQALAVAALLLARADTPRTMPLPVWAAWPAIGQSASFAWSRRVRVPDRASSTGWRRRPEKVRR
jgi:hypothetical protein